MNYFVISGADRKITVGGKVYEPTVTSFNHANNTYWGVLAVESSSDASALKQIGAKKGIYPSTEDEYERMLAKKKTPRNMGQTALEGSRMVPDTKGNPLLAQPAEVVGKPSFDDNPAPKPAGQTTELVIASVDMADGDESDGSDDTAAKSTSVSVAESDDIGETSDESDDETPEKTPTPKKRGRPKKAK